MGWLRVRLGGALMVGVLVVGACSNDPGGPEDFGLLPPVDPDETTTSSSTTTTTLPSTTTTTTEPTSSTSSTLPNGKPILEIPTEWDSDLEEIIGRYLLYWEAYDIAHGPPAAVVDYEPLRELAGEELYSDLQGYLAGKADRGHVVRVDGTVTTHVPRLPNPSVLDKREGSEVVIQDCFVDGRIVQSIQGEIINDQVEATLFNVLMQVRDGEWRVAGVIAATAESDGFEECNEYGEQFE